MTGVCYRILENPTIGHQKYRATRDAVTHLLATALTHYDHMFSEFLLFLPSSGSCPHVFSLTSFSLLSS